MPTDPRGLRGEAPFRRVAAFHEDAPTPFTSGHTPPRPRRGDVVAGDVPLYAGPTRCDSSVGSLLPRKRALPPSGAQMSAGSPLAGRRMRTQALASPRG
jgi:hypothetical protein